MAALMPSPSAKLLAAATLSCLALAAPALAAHVGGATYSGTYGNGAGPIELTLSADGARVVAYRIPDIKGDTCQFFAQGKEGDFEAPITQERFEYRLYDAIRFEGTFGAGGAASGTFRLYNEAVGDRPACDTGVVPWTATGPSAPPAGSTPPAGGGPGAGGLVIAGPAPGTVVPGLTTTAFRTGLSPLRRTLKRISGRVSSKQAACRRGRTVLLRRGTKTLAKTTSKADGTFSFARRTGLRGRRLSIRVEARTKTAPACTAASSKRFLA